MDDLAEQRSGSPLSREVGNERRTGRRQLSPSDPATTRDVDDEDDDPEVEWGGRTRDSMADGTFGDVDQRRSPDRRSTCSPPVQRRQQMTGSSAAAPQIRSTISRPVQLQLTGGVGRGSLGLCWPHGDDENSTTGAQRGALFVHSMSGMPRHLRLLFED